MKTKHVLIQPQLCKYCNVKEQVQFYNNYKQWILLYKCLTLSHSVLEVVPLKFPKKAKYFLRGCKYFIFFYFFGLKETTT